MSRRHNDANVMCLSADLLGDRLLTRIVETWLSTAFEGGRHARRVEKIRAIEEEQRQRTTDA
jgi:ribose 5-phosphate isomerase B